MADAAADVLKALNDPSKWEIRDEVNVFDEHTEAKPDGTVEVFDRTRLERIAANCNARDQIGQPCPLALGHTRDGEPEDVQPAIVGYARRFRVVWDDRLQRNVIRATYYVRRELMQEAQTYPRTSVERWPVDDFFDPISLLRRTPQRDLGQWTYGRKGYRVRYSMEQYAMESNDVNPAVPSPIPSATPAPTMPGARPDADGANDYARTCAHIDQYMKERFPHLGAMHEKYAAAMAPPGPAAMPPAPPAAAAPAAPAATTGVPPAPPAPRPSSDPTTPHPKSAPAQEQERARMQHDQLAIQYQRLEADLAAEKYARRKAESERIVIQLEAEGYRIPDRAREVERMAQLNEAQRAEREAEIRQCYQKAPVGDVRGGGAGQQFFPTARVREGGQAKQMGPDEYRAARKYMKAKGCTWEEAMEHIQGTGTATANGAAK